MSNNARDEQFAGFAKALLSKMLDHHDGWIDFNEDNPEEIEAYSEIIAHAAYDLSLHVLDHIEDGGMFAGLHERLLEDVPDMLELPEEKSE